ncbi:serine hydrolase [Flavobacterium xueshanense]|nr:serine hydrolase [Flavobacterium xueshanense]
MEKPEEFELQIIYTEIIRDDNHQVKFKDYTYNLNAKNYFYPASTVKLPIAVLALEKLNSIRKTSINSEFSIEGTIDKFKFSEEISKVFAVSDNDASNRLLEFVGFDYLNKSMTDKGLQDFKVIHRLSTPDSGNPVTKGIILYKDDNSVVEIPSVISKPRAQLQLEKMKKGIGYMKDDKLISTPFDFSGKNYYSLESLHSTMKRIVFPEAFKENQRFHLSKNDREFILFSLQNLPKNAGYDPVEFYDGFGKFLMFGDTKSPMPENIKIYNKVGDAYGTLIDCAYIVDEKNKIEFMVSTTILVNKDGIFNDDTYEYEEIGLPFLAELGRQLYDKNLKKKSN